MADLFAMTLHSTPPITTHSRPQVITAKKNLVIGWPTHFFANIRPSYGHLKNLESAAIYITILWPFHRYDHSYGQKSSDGLIRPPLWPDLIVAINRNTHKNLKITISVYYQYIATHRP